MLRKYASVGEDLSESMHHLTGILRGLVPHVHAWKRRRRAWRNIKRLLGR